MKVFNTGVEMKKILIIIMACTMLLMACNSEAVTNNTQVAEVEETEVVVEETAETTEVEEVEEEVVEEEEEDLDNPKLPATMTYIGRATMKFEFADGMVLYIDPYAGDEAAYDVPADLVLVTHQHSDHNKVDMVTLNEGGQIIQCPTDMVEGDTIEVNGLEITAVPAYNSNHKRDRCCGFLIKFGGMTLYHSGDTSFIPEMEALAEERIDFAFVTMDGVWNMGHVEAKLVADTIKAEKVIPIHTDGDLDWNQEIADAFMYEDKIVVKPGETLEIK